MVLEYIYCNSLVHSVNFYLRSDLHVPKKCFICFSPFHFILKALFILRIFKFLDWIFGYLEKTTWLERSDYFQNLWRQNLVNKQLQYYPISQVVKATRNEIRSIDRIQQEKHFFFQKSCRKWGRETSFRPL